MTRPLSRQSDPRQKGSPTVLVEGQPAVVLDIVDTKSGELPEALPSVLVEGRPVVVFTPGQSGAATVLGGG